MTKFRWIACCLLLFSQWAAAQTVGLKDITSGKFSARGVSKVASSPDGEYFYKADGGKHVVKYAFKTGLPVDTVFSVSKARECSFARFDGFEMSPDEKRILLYCNAEQIYRHSFRADYYYYDIRRNLVSKLTDKKAKQSVPIFSKDGRMLAYVCENNIWLVKFDYGSESQITKDGSAGKIINGATDWVYEEELATTHIMDFSADNKLLAFVRFDESQVREYSFQSYRGGLYPQLQSFKYPKAGEQNSGISLHVFDIENKTTRKVDLPSSDVEYIPAIRFLPNESSLAVMTLNRTQNVFAMYVVNPRSLVAKEVLREQSEYYIDSELISQIRFIPGHFIYLSERSGYTQAYLYTNTGILKKQLTNGKFDLTNLLAVDAASQTIYYQAASVNAMQREIFKLNMVKGNAVCLTPKAGTNRAYFAENGKYFINTWSDAQTPPVVTVNDNNGKQLRVLEDNNALQAVLKTVRLPKREFITLNAADGTPLNAYLMKPTNFDATKKYPVVMVQYSGPNSQQVLNSYNVDWTSYLAEQGYIVACVDGRGTGARGEKFRKQTYLQLGVLESDDQIAAAKQLGKMPFADAQRIAIWGWSFGGYNVLMCMGRGNGTFKAGVSIAPVADWKFYDTIYTERFMRTPQENASGYAKSSALSYVNTFSGNLLLMHGTADDNVHFHNATEYTQAMVDADKQFEMFTFPDKDHFIHGGNTRYYLYKKVVDFFGKNL